MTRRAGPTARRRSRRLVLLVVPHVPVDEILDVLVEVEGRGRHLLGAHQEIRPDGCARCDAQSFVARALASAALEDAGTADGTGATGARVDATDRTLEPRLLQGGRTHARTTRRCELVARARAWRAVASVWNEIGSFVSIFVV